MVAAILIALLGCEAVGNAGSSAPDEDLPGSAVVPASLDWTIGDPGEPDPDYQFAEVLDVLAARDGSVWVVDGDRRSGTITRPQVRQFDSTGRFVRRVGGEGDGPGEFRAPYGLAELRDGRVAVRDNAFPERVHLYRANGQHDTTWVLPVAGRWEVGAGQSVQVDTGGVVWLPVRGGRPGPNRAGYSYLRLRPDGTALDEIAPPVLPTVEIQRAGVTRQLPGGGLATVGVAAPYQPRAISAWSPRGYFAVARTDEYRIEFSPASVEPGASRPALITRRTARVRIEEAERASLRRAMETEAARLGIAGRITIPAVAAHKPPLRNVAFTDDGRLLSFISASSRRDGDTWLEPTQLDVFEADGRFVGRVGLPAAFEVFRMARDRIWGRMRAADGTEMVQRYRIVWSTGTGG